MIKGVAPRIGWPEVLVVRAWLAVYLIGFVALCPVVCGAGELSCGSCADVVSDASHEKDSSPAHCPEGRDNCICDGAVAQADVRIDGLGASALVDLGDFLPMVSPIVSRLAAHHLTFDGSPTGLAGWGDASAVRAGLQIFRF